MPAAPEDAQDFARAFRSFLEWVHQAPADGGSGEVVRLLADHLGPDRSALSVVTKELPAYEHVNLQAALDAWRVQPGRTADVHGVALPPNWGSISLHQLLTGHGLPPLRLSAPALVDLPSGPDATLACLQSAVVLITDERGAYALLVSGPVKHQEPSLTLEVAGLEVGQAQAVQAELVALASRLNVHRGQVLELGMGPSGLALSFVRLPQTERADVVLPDAVLTRIERHTVEIGGHREGLLAAGQHLKRGLLLYGPPGTGKTHTTRYVIGRMAGCTVLMLSGQSLHMVGAVAGLARELQPAVIVLEDVDLVAEDRGFGPGSSPVLFELLDAMDGAAADADLLFLLTTNRADLLEPALAARPGRVDVAVEIGLPDAGARGRLLELYGRSVPLDLTQDDVAVVVERTEGTTASFMKELLRRAVLEALVQDPQLSTVTGAHVRAALDDLLDSTQEVTRALLGVGGSRPAGRAAGGHGGMTGAYASTLEIGPGPMPTALRE